MDAGTLRILVLTSTLPARPGDGTPEFVLTLSLKMADSAVVKILAPRVKSGVGRVNGVEIRRFPYFPKRFESLAADAILPELRRRPWKLFEAVSLLMSFVLHTIRFSRELRPDVIHAHWLIPGGLSAWLASIVTRTPYIVTVHGADAHALTGPVAKWLRGRVMRRAHRVIPVSREIASVLGLDPRTALPMGVDLEAWDLPSGPQQRRSGRFVFVGRLAEKKGLTIALRALTKVPGAHLTVVGDGPDRQMLEQLTSELDIASRVHFKGTQPSRVAREFLRTANAALIPSVVAGSGDRDGTPVVLAEAVALGTPVIASRLGGIVDIVDERMASLVAPGDPDELAEAMRFVMDHQEAVEERAAEARALVIDRLDASSIAHTYIGILEQAARGSQY